ncbi:MAG: winged helix-turn-helix transcriptional regulator [Clostridiales bacterium]|nr:winged helix-turn-helix transcriptional regulator [Clostridiales bacterium]
MSKCNHNAHEKHRPIEDKPTMFLVSEVSKLFHDRLRALSDQMGIPDGYRHILFSLKYGDGKTQCEISQITHLKAPTISVALQKMEADGLITRVSDEDDLRQSRIFITEKGRETMHKFHANLVMTEEMVLSGLSDEEEQTLREILIKMRENFIDNE